MQDGENRNRFLRILIIIIITFENKNIIFFYLIKLSKLQFSHFLLPHFHRIINFFLLFISFIGHFDFLLVHMYKIGLLGGQNDQVLKIMSLFNFGERCLFLDAFFLLYFVSLQKHSFPTCLVHVIFSQLKLFFFSFLSYRNFDAECDFNLFFFLTS